MRTDAAPKPIVALGVMLAILAVPYISPKMRALRVTTAPWDSEPAIDDRAAPPVPMADPASGALQPTEGDMKLRSSENEGTVTNALPAAGAPAEDLPIPVAERAIEDASGHALDAFYARLAATDAKTPGAVTHILHYGDSLITADYISGSVRRKMQSRFGDAGHGFLLIANPWEWYFHNDVSHSAGEGWSAQRITGPFTGDGRYGLGGVTFHSTGGARASFGTATSGDYGRHVSRFEIYYLEQPNGGDVEVRVKNGATEKFSTRGAPGAGPVSREHDVEVPDGEASMSLFAAGNGDARLFGVELARDVPGVRYSALGANGARVRLLGGMNEAHWKEQMDIADPALVILQYGTNESEDGSLGGDAYAKALANVVEAVKRAAPHASVLLCAPLDRAEKSESGALTSKPIIAKLVDAQRKVASEHGVAFWDTYSAMGGAGSMAKWVHAEPQLGSWDLTHPTPTGAEVIGARLYNSLVAGYGGWKKAGGKPAAVTPRQTGQAAQTQAATPPTGENTPRPDASPSTAAATPRSPDSTPAQTPTGAPSSGAPVTAPAASAAAPASGSAR